MEYRALFFCPFVAWGQALGAEIFERRAARECAHRNGHVRWSIDRGACFWDRLAGLLCHDGQSQNIGGFALVCGHAERGVAFEVLDTDIAFLVGEFHVFDRHIVLEIDPSAIFAWDVPIG